MDPVLNENLVRREWERCEAMARGLGFRLIKQVGVDLYFATTTRDGREEAFCLGCDDYPDRAPALSFVDPATLQPVARAYPQCISGIRSYYALHQERLREPDIAWEWRLGRALATVYTIVHGTLFAPPRRPQNDPRNYRTRGRLPFQARRPAKRY